MFTNPFGMLDVLGIIKSFPLDDNFIIQPDECYQPAGWMLSSNRMNAIIQPDECYRPAGWKLSSSRMNAIIRPDECYIQPDVKSAFSSSQGDNTKSNQYKSGRASKKN